MFSIALFKADDSDIDKASSTRITVNLNKMKLFRMIDNVFILFRYVFIDRKNNRGIWIA